MGDFRRTDFLARTRTDFGYVSVGEVGAEKALERMQRRTEAEKQIEKKENEEAPQATHIYDPPSVRRESVPVNLPVPVPNKQTETLILVRTCSLDSAKTPSSLKQEALRLTDPSSLYAVAPI